MTTHLLIILSAFVRFPSKTAAFYIFIISRYLQRRQNGLYRNTGATRALMNAIQQMDTL